MKHCSQCGTKVNSDAKFCQNCGAGLNIDISNRPVDANLKVSLTNETTEKVLKGVGGSISSITISLTTFIKRIIKPVIIIAILGVVVSGIGSFIYESKREAQREHEDALERQAMTFEKEKALGDFQIEAMTLNNKFISYFGQTLIEYSDTWPYDGSSVSDQRPTGRVTISDKEMIVHIDWDRDNRLSAKEKKTFIVKSILQSTNPDYYNYGVIETDLDKKVIFEIRSVWGGSFNYRLHYKIGEDSYQLWLK